MIKLINVAKYYKPNVVALKDINLEIGAGEFVSIVGQSGTGKTTIVKLIIAEERPSEGRIIIGGWDITNIAGWEVPYLRRQIGVVFQDFKLLKKKTVFENVAFALQTCGAPKKRIENIIPQVLRIVGLEKKIDRYPYQLSGGEQQRVVIARSLVHKPKLLVADEPTGNLDSINTREIIDLLKKINELGTTVILVTHNREVVNNLKKRVITIDNGQIIGDQEKGRYVL
jgi:cell division transport system ATP-binding protein